MTWLYMVSIVMSLAAFGFTIAAAHERRKARRAAERAWLDAMRAPYSGAAVEPPTTSVNEPT